MTVRWVNYIIPGEKMDLRKNGKLLCDLRKAKGMTQKQVADKLGISQSYISRLEKKIINRLKKEINKMI